MSLEDSRELVKAILKRRSQSLAEELGINVVSNDAEELFCLLIAALLLSARIGHRRAMKSARILFDRGWTTPRKMAATTWAQRVKALDEGGYARYDERTSTMLGDTAQMAIEKYSGDLRNLRDAARDEASATWARISSFARRRSPGRNCIRLQTGRFSRQRNRSACRRTRRSSRL